MKIAFPKSLSLLATLLMVTASSVTFAQPLTADQVLEQIKAEAESIEDATFLLAGRLIDPDGTAITLEVDIEVIPGEEVARATFFQPAALADNVVVFEGDTVYNYIFLTNQVTLFDANDPDALGGFLGGEESGEGFSFTLDLDALFAGWEASIESYEGGTYPSASTIPRRKPRSTTPS
jgi:opacity protein-like surface antigen